MSLQKMTANICMCNENNKHNVKQRIAIFLIRSLEAGSKIYMMSYIVGSLAAAMMTGSSAN